jgi:hypothetical protein
LTSWEQHKQGMRLEVGNVEAGEKVGEFEEIG